MFEVTIRRAVSHGFGWLANGSERWPDKNSPAHFRPPQFRQLKTEN